LGRCAARTFRPCGSSKNWLYDVVPALNTGSTPKDAMVCGGWALGRVGF
jgi:hypothetical protein